MANESDPMKGSEDSELVYHNVYVNVSSKRLEEVLGHLSGMNVAYEELKGGLVIHDVTRAVAEQVLAWGTAERRPIEPIASDNYL